MGKFIWHKSCPLKEGVLPSRMVYVMRFLNCKARYLKIIIEGTYLLINSIGSDVQSDIGYRLGDLLEDGDVIAQNLASLNKNWTLKIGVL